MECLVGNLVDRRRPPSGRYIFVSLEGAGRKALPLESRTSVGTDEGRKFVRLILPHFSTRKNVL